MCRRSYLTWSPVIVSQAQRRTNSVYYVPGIDTDVTHFIAARMTQNKVYTWYPFQKRGCVFLLFFPKICILRTIVVCLTFFGGGSRLEKFYTNSKPKPDLEKTERAI